MGKQALLTIDDGPSVLTPRLLRFLNDENIPAVMFFQGNHLEQHPHEALAALEQGMTVGNHGYSHRGFSSLSLPEAEAEIGRTEELLDTLHQRAGVRRTLRLFRFPYGDKGGPLRGALSQVLLGRGFDVLDTSGVTYPWFEPVRRDPDVFWTFDTGDYKVANPAFGATWADLLAHLDESQPIQGGSLVGASDEIVLLHDHPHTDAIQPEYYRDLVLGIQERGVAFVGPVIEPPSTPTR